MSAKKVAVLDIGSDAVTLVMQDRKYANNFAFKASADYYGYQDGEFLDIEGLFRVVDSLVRECEASAFCELDEIMVGVPGEFTAIVCNMVEQSLGAERKVTDRDLDALYAIGNNYHGEAGYTCISASPVYYVLDDSDYTITPAGRTASKIGCLMSYAVCENSFISLFDRISESVKVPFVYASSVLAEVMYVVPERYRDEGVILADVGYISTSVAYAMGDGILHATAFSLGKGNIAGDITTVDGVPFDVAMELVDKMNLNLQPSMGDTYCVSRGGETLTYDVSRINAIAYDRVQNIAEYIHKAIQLSEYEVPREAKILLTGSGISSIPGARECLSKVTGRTVEILQPDLMQFNKPRHSSLAGLLIVQQHQIVKGKLRLFDLLYKLKDKFFGRNKK